MSVQSPSFSLAAFSDSLAQAVQEAGASVVSVHARRGVPSSGLVWREGVIVTADHTVQSDENIIITLPDGQSTPAALAGRDPGTDLAVLRFQSDIAPARHGDASPIQVGALALAVARPGEIGLSASWGVVSATGGPWRTWSGGQVDRFIRPDLTLYPGFSGGPLIDGSGGVIGINTSGLHRAMAITIPASTVERVVQQLLQRGHIARGYLGIGMQRVRLPEQIAQSLQPPANTGLIVVSVEPGGPADKAGVLVGDILVALEGQPVGNTDQVQAMLEPERVGSAINAQIVRGGKPETISITVGERPRSNG